MKYQENFKNVQTLLRIQLVKYIEIVRKNFYAISQTSKLTYDMHILLYLVHKNILIKKKYISYRFIRIKRYPYIEKQSDTQIIKTKQKKRFFIGNQ